MNYKFISIGACCAGAMILGEKRIRGPIDNVECLHHSYISELFNGKLFEKIEKDKYNWCRPRHPGFTNDGTIKYNYGCFNVIHNDPTTEKFKKEFLKRCENFKDFYNHINEPEYYFVYTFRWETIDKIKHIVKPAEFEKTILIFKELNLLEKIIFVSTKVETLKNLTWNFYANDIQKYIETYNLKHVTMIDVKPFEENNRYDGSLIFQDKVNMLLK